MAGMAFMKELIADYPAGRYRGEITPLIVGAEFRRPIAPDGLLKAGISFIVIVQPANGR